MLARVRGLLAKAEATTFPEEAEAFTAKAQELMTRYAIDRAMLDDGAGRSESPAGVRVRIDDPYASAKAMLLQGIATANGCSAVWDGYDRIATVFGFPAPLEAVEMLYTSLLLQATSTLTRLGRRPGYHTRSRAYRRAFLVAFASRIRERLLKAAAETTAQADAEHDGRLLPVLAARDDEVLAARDAAFPMLRKMSYSISSAEGWHAGRAAADLASLTGNRAIAP